MNIGILGAGRVGGTVGRRWQEAGHAVLFGVRDPSGSRADEVRAAVGAEAMVGTLAEAGAWGEVVLLATPWPAAQDALRQAGDLRGKIIIDATNIFGEPTPVHGSGAQDVAAWSGSRRVVKAFNSTGSGNMANPRYGDQAADMFICGDDTEAKAVVGRLAAALGFDVVDAGGLENAALLESLARLWVTLLRPPVGLGPNIAFKLLRR